MRLKSALCAAMLAAGALLFTSAVPAVADGNGCTRVTRADLFNSSKPNLGQVDTVLTTQWENCNTHTHALGGNRLFVIESAGGVAGVGASVTG